MSKLMRFVMVLSILFGCYSCDYFSFQRKNDFEKINSDIDVTSVDTPPSFGRCDSLIDKQKKTDCFYEEIHKKLSENLKNQQIQVKKNVDEIVTVVLSIQSDKSIGLKSMKSSPELLEEIPKLEEIIRKAIAVLPKIEPAYKRGIPVTSEYTLPIRISIQK